MEPDLYVLSRPPAGVQGTHAGDHAVGPGPGERGGEWVLGRGKDKMVSNIQKLRVFFFFLFFAPLSGCKAEIGLTIVELTSDHLDHKIVWIKNNNSNNNNIFYQNLNF